MLSAEEQNNLIQIKQLIDSDQRANLEIALSLINAVEIDLAPSINKIKPLLAFLNTVPYYMGISLKYALSEFSKIKYPDLEAQIEYDYCPYSRAELLQLLYIQDCQSLSFKHKKLKFIHEDIHYFEALEKIDFSMNLLKFLPDSITTLNQLKQLNLNKNKLTQLPVDLGLLSNLEELKLSNNNLTALPESIGQLQQLTFLEIRDNKLKTLPQSITDLQKLQYLYLGNNQFSPQEKKKIKQMMSHCQINFN